MDSITLYPGLNTPLWEYGLSTVDPVTGAVTPMTTGTVTATLVDQFGGTVGPLTYTFQAGPQTAPDGTVYPAGNWLAFVPPTAAIGLSSLYLGTVTITPSGGQAQTEYFQAAAYNCAGYYTSAFAVMAKWGSANVIIWTNKDDQSTTAINAVSMVQALNWADERINAEMRNGPYTVPLTPLNADLADIANDICAFHLYESRGLYDEKMDKLGGKLAAANGSALSRLAAYRSGIRSLTCTRRWPAPTAPMTFPT